MLLFAVSALSACASTSSTPFDVRAARRDAALRTRRIIMNNDGNDCTESTEVSTGPHTAEEMLSRRATALVGSHVDSIFYCDGVFSIYTHQSDVTELRRETSATRYAWGDELFKTTGKDPLATMIGFCREHEIEIFWSMRMNDTHDSSAKNSPLMPQWKKDHPELLLSTADDVPPYGGKRWSAVRYDEPQVREQVFRILEDVVTRYDVDGVELDFFRHPVYFAAAAQGEPVPEAQQGKLTELLQRVRDMVDAVAAERGKPILIAVRVPDSVPFCSAMGLDLDRWLTDGLLDLVVGGGYIHLQPWADWVALGKSYDVPVYAGLSASRLVSSKQPGGHGRSGALARRGARRVGCGRRGHLHVQSVRPEQRTVPRARRSRAATHVAADVRGQQRQRESPEEMGEGRRGVR